MMLAVRSCTSLHGPRVYPHVPVMLSMSFLSTIGRTLAWVQRAAPPLAPRLVFDPAPQFDPRWKYSAAELREAAEGMTKTAKAVLEGDEAAEREWGSGAAMRTFHRAMNRWQDLAAWELAHRVCDPDVGADEISRNRAADEVCAWSRSPPSSSWWRSRMRRQPPMMRGSRG